MECLLNKLTPLYFKIYYKEENYLKVKTIVFKYITPPHSNGLSILVYWYAGVLNILYIYIPTFPTPVRTEPLLYAIYVTQLPLVLWFYWFYQSCLSRTDFNLS